MTGILPAFSKDTALKRTSNLPDVTLECLGSRAAGGKPSVWKAAWRVFNRGDSPVQALSCWLPHDQFNSERLRFQPPLELQPFGTLDLDIMVTCEEPPGTSFDAAFVILEILSEESRWRVFARHLITVAEDGIPYADCKSVTIQPASGFDSSGK